jgi:hypothetical protein
MTKINKLRGHRRLWSKIEKWKNSNLELDLDSLKIRESNYVKIWLHPFSSLNVTNSQYLEPKGKTKEKLLNGLFDIYENWKIQLDSLDEPYYLKIWLFEPRFSNSQVVCAIGNSIDNYQMTFDFADKPIVFKSKIDRTNNNRINSFNWEHRIDQDFLDNTDEGMIEEFETESDYFEHLRWFKNQMKKPHKKTIIKNSESEMKELYAFTIGDVWLGDKSLT